MSTPFENPDDNSDMIMTLTMKQRRLQSQIDAINANKLNDLQAQLKSINATIDVLNGVNQGKLLISTQNVDPVASQSLVSKIKSFFGV